MNEFSRTAAMVVLAAGLVGAVYMTRPAPVKDAAFSDVGQPLFPEFVDPTKAASLEVVAYDDATATFRPFRVAWDGRKWVIPSHHNYPADAKENMAQAASAFIGVTREVIASDRASDHEALGVIDPTDATATGEGRGTRVTLKDESGSVLADLIIGKEATGLSAAGGGGEGGGNKRYVRIPSQQRTSIVTFSKTFSTNFSDWAQTDLLQMSGQQVAKVAVDRYSIDEQQGTKQVTERLILQRDASMGAAEPHFGWKLESSAGGGPGPGEQINLTEVNDVSAALRELRIAGVRPKPEKLVKLFGGEQAETQLDAMDAINLRSRGFFVSAQGALLANEGQASYVTADGVSYNFYFGEVLFGEGEAISAGSDAPLGPAEGDAQATDEKKGAETRYVFIDASVDATLFPEPTPPGPPPPPAPAPAPTPKPEGQAEGEAAEPASETPPDPALAAYEEAKKKYEADVADRAKKLEEAKTKAEGLRKKFAQWYYVIDAASFARLRPTRADLVQATPAPTETAPPAQAVPITLDELNAFEAGAVPPPAPPSEEPAKPQQ